MTDTTPALSIDTVVLDSLGETLFRRFNQYETDRRIHEERWLKNLRQVRKIYDPEVLKLIPADMSKAYPGITQFMVRGTIARLMQLLFPMTEKNYSVKESPLPDLSTEQLQQVLDQLVAAKQQAQAQPPAVAGAAPAAPAPVTLTTEEIEKGILAFAKGKAARMEVKVEDDLQQMDFITMIRKVVKSAVQYSIGIARGPLHTKVKARTWEQDPNTGRYVAKEVDKFKPLFEYLPVWNHYPDLTAVSLDKQDGSYDRHIMTRIEVQELIDRPDFLGDRIKQYLADHPEGQGNYRSRWWEESIKAEPKSGQAPVMDKQGRKFELLSYWGGVTGAQLRAAGNQVNDADLSRVFMGNVWHIDGLVIKARISPLPEGIKTHHYFVFEDDDLSPLGNSQPETLRDSQMAVCETARAALDNMSVIGPMAEVNESLLAPGQDLSIRKHKTWRRDDEGASAQYQAVRNINIESHLSELTALMGVFQAFAEKESGLPPPSLGDTSGAGSEALRTSKNASMFLGAAALPIRDTVRNYDTFTVSLISALVAWNMQFDADPSRDGDHDVIARGSTSLIAKEVQASALSELATSLTPAEQPHLNGRGLYIMRLKALDLPTDDLLVDEDTANQTIQANAAAAQALQSAQTDLLHGQFMELLSQAQVNMAKAEGEGAKSGVAVLQTLIDAMAQGNKASNDAAANVVTLAAAHRAADSAETIAASRPAKAAA